ncbi:hypothetical protein D9756_005768 [Leucocoprinus leucothites]|uniref:Transmembrane protein n=1 Tax=Leucocoprinus leucothites TaxID=201217 RepID=A0A8H5FZL1_9AGAR|nr:hypothetical protein D9756_005768 [Leucoagaricus leucothites]
MPSPSPPPSLLDSNEYRLISLQNKHDPHPHGTDVLILSPKESHHPRSPLRNLKMVFLLRIGAFIMIELGFITLASFATSKSNTLPLHLSPTITLSEAKGALTIISVIWHALAVFTVREILLHVFSAEWMELARQSGKAVLRETDIVSRITTGYVDQITHFGSKRATTPFRLGFICALLLLVLNGLGPSVITANSISVQKPMKITVANLTMTENVNDSDEGTLVPYRADLITRLEQLENSIYGFRGQQPNVLIPWPSSDLISANSTTQYQSNVITFGFNCSWKVPIGDLSEIFLQIDSKNWGVFTEALGIPNLRELSDATILPMEEVSDSHGKLSADSPLSGFIFVGSNTTISDQVALNLDGIPAALSSGQLSRSAATTNATDDLLITALICDPQFKISPATVTLQSGTLWADIQPGLPPANNIPPEAANAIFSQSLLFATSTREAWGDAASLVNNIARILFLSDPSFEYTSKPAGIKPLPLDEINRQMDKVLLSSAKAYLSGYRPDIKNLTFPSFEMIDSDAIGEVEQLVLVGSRPFLIALVVVVVVLVVLLITLVAMVKVDQLQTFDLENIVKALRIH